MHAFLVAIMEDSLFFLKRKHKQPKLRGHVGLDLLGGDRVDSLFIKQTLCAVAKRVSSHVSISLFLTQELEKELSSFVEKLTKTSPLKINIVIVSEVIHMEDEPLTAVRKKKDSSLIRSIIALENGSIDALLSTGNTGALVAATTFHVPFLKGFNRPLLLASLPTKKNHSLAVLDVGAHTEISPKLFEQMAMIGISYKNAQGIKEPKVGLLNIGVEEKKGHSQRQITYAQLQSLNTQFPHQPFVGNVEPSDVFSGDLHVLLTDGFTGNVFLKTAEGISSFIMEILKENQTHPLLSQKLVKAIEKELYQEDQYGALFVGIDRLITKCHGSASPDAISKSLFYLLGLLSQNFLAKVKKNLG
ncbi:hypothetical protein COB21_00465 [Candidatus Aerophobetes bacterium]|uniref:Phosphate acyltransferase n=1 Tax=Aerophobetes bacterium TaxID=2030807 RepID=A0A2A4X7W4_UNCAE|nr:MAG: hypothetical protein COB21_00465 [Candidatus Aerophobetes bacterium]